jgi:hypothetical protein
VIYVRKKQSITGYLVVFLQTLAVLNPFRTTDASILQDSDLAGPLVFCLALGAFLLLVSTQVNLPCL